MDDDGYPDEEELKRIKEWRYDDFPALMEYIKPLWQYGDCGYWRQEDDKFYLSTAGWSGNEDIIAALKENPMFWAFCAYRWQRGGHYVFEVKKLEEKSPAAPIAALLD